MLIIAIPHADTKDQTWVAAVESQFSSELTSQPSLKPGIKMLVTEGPDYCKTQTAVVCRWKVPSSKQRKRGTELWRMQGSYTMITNR